MDTEPNSFEIPQFSPIDDVATRLTFDDIPVDHDDGTQGGIPSASPASAPKSALINSTNTSNNGNTAGPSGTRVLKSALRSSKQPYRVSTPGTHGPSDPTAVARSAALQPAPPREVVSGQRVVAGRRMLESSEEEQLWQRFREAGVDEVSVLKKERDALVDKIKFVEDQVRFRSLNMLLICNI